MPMAFMRFARSTGNSGMWEMIQRRFVKRNLRIHRLAILDQVA